ncbi:aspartic peptidase domain-containing protein [Mycena capillaripes]|nr:aspartic peptidase domain-containing protein [Mycena capillaripes]
MEIPSHFPGFFDVELKIGPLDQAAELLDSQAARLRYMTRRQWSESSEQAPNPSTAIFSAKSSTANTASTRTPGQSRSGEHFLERYAAQPVPVHSDLGPALVVQDPGYDQFLTTSMATKARGKFCQVVTKLRFGEPGGMTKAVEREFPFEVDLGKNPLPCPSCIREKVPMPFKSGLFNLRPFVLWLYSWVYGRECQIPKTPYPKGTIGSPAMFWHSFGPHRSSQQSDRKHNTTYADGSIVHYTLWDDYIYLRPQRRPPPEADPKRAWVQLIFGVAHEVSHDFQYSPSSGILGLGRRISRNPDDVDSTPPTFLQQVRGRLQSPEFAILLTDTIGFVTFGRRAVFEPTEYPWHTYLPLLGNDHWKVASTVKELNGVRYVYEGGEAELDTGTAFCYMNQNFVDAFYSCIPGFVVRPAPNANAPATVRPQNVYYIPVDSSAVPNVRLDIGGHMFTLELMHLPGGMKHVIGTELYYIGAMQSKTVLFPSANHEYDGPDLIGRGIQVALVNMEVVFQMPYDKPHTISWRRKAKNFTGPAPTDWK